MKCLALTGLVCFAVVFSHVALLPAAADPWIEVKSTHFTVWSNADDGRTRTLAWQLEQIRSALAALWPWARVDLGKPMLVLGVKDENSLRALAPAYWEQRGGVRPASVWVTGADQHYIAIRADLRGDDRDTLNPHITAYFAYVSLVLQSSFGRQMPLWFSRGLSGVLSNTIVRDNYILLGPPIPWHLDRLRERTRLPLGQLVNVTRSSPEYKLEEGLARFDAQSWAFVHFLMFGDEGAYQQRLNRFAALLTAGKDVSASLRETLGPVEDYERPFWNYINRSLYAYHKNVVDASVRREGFASRPLAPAEAAAGRAAFHVALRRPNEARTLIGEARKADPSLAASYAVEGLQLETEGKRVEAKAAYARAVELGSSSAYAHYRFAILSWGTEPDHETLVRIEKSLTRAVELDTRFAAAYAALGEARAALNQSTDAAVSLVRRAVSLDPSNAYHHLSAARVFWRGKNYDEARKEAQAALALAEDDEERSEAQKILNSIEQEKSGAARRAGSAANAATSSSNNVSSNPNALASACQGGDVAACRTFLPIAEQACASRNGSACGILGWLHENGRGVTADLPRAADFYQQACDARERRGCLALAVMQARGNGIPKDEARASSTFEQLCNGGLLESCTQWAVLLASRPQNPDLSRARQLLSKSCDGGFTQACDLMKSLPKNP